MDDRDRACDLEHDLDLLAAWHALTERPGTSVLRDLRAAWPDPDATYATAEHLRHGLALLDTLRHRLRRPDEARIAWWFHCSGRASTVGDARRSAAWAFRALTSYGARRDVGERVRALVLAAADATATREDAAVLVDVDLAMLGLPPEAYDDLEAEIRREHAAVSDEAWRAGRFAVLRQIARREPLYVTPELAILAPIAHANLWRTIAALDPR